MRQKARALWGVVRAHALFLWRVQLTHRCCMTCANTKMRLNENRPRRAICACRITRKWAPAHYLCKKYQREVPPCKTTEK